MMWKNYDRLLGYTAGEAGAIRRFCGARATEYTVVTPEWHAWLLTDAGLLWRFEGREENEGKGEAEIVAYWREQVADDPCGWLYDEPAAPLERQIRKQGFSTEQFLTFDCAGSWNVKDALGHVYAPRLLRQAQAWEARCGEMVAA